MGLERIDANGWPDSIPVMAPDGRIVFHSRETHLRGALAWTDDGTAVMDAEKKRRGWVFLDEGNCSPRELAKLQAWKAKNDATRGHAPPMPLEDLPNVVRVARNLPPIPEEPEPPKQVVKR